MVRSIAGLAQAILMCCLLPLAVAAQEKLFLIPQPQKAVLDSGSFEFLPVTKVVVSVEFQESVGLLQEHPFLHSTEPERIKNRKKLSEEGVQILKAEPGDALEDRAYRISISPEKLVVLAHKEETLLSALQTLQQLAYTHPAGKIPACEIEDWPNLAQRGFQLDLSGRFLPVHTIRKYLDLMSLYKLNVFQWRLSGNGGWRLELKGQPELTNATAWRSRLNYNDWVASGKNYARFGDPNASGGYYNQKDLKELIDYAKARGILIIPEIDLIGLADELLVTYPELACGNREDSTSSICPGDEAIFTRLFSVLDETAELFPGNFLHVGTRMPPSKAWDNCADCKKRMEDEKLASSAELQNYFIRRLTDHLKSNGKTLLSATAQNNLSSGAEGSLLTPEAFLHFDSYQYDPSKSPESKNVYLPLEKVYSYDPNLEALPEGVPDKKLGIQATLTTEYISSIEQMDYQAFPRLLALADVAWTNPAERDWEHFKLRLQQHYKLLQAFHVNYYPPSVEVGISGTFDKARKRETVRFSSEQYHPEIHYTIDGSEPTVYSPEYLEPLNLISSTRIRAAVFRDSVRFGPVASYQTDVHSALGKKIAYNKPYDATFPAGGDDALLDGQKGGVSYKDGAWQGFNGDLDVTIDFERREELKKLKIRFMQRPQSGIYFPGSVMILASDDGRHFRELKQLKSDIPNNDRLRFKNVEVELESRPVRYLRVIGTNTKKALLFADELVIY